MPFEVRYSDESLVDLKQIRQYDQTAIMDQIQQVLTVNPTLESKSIIKQLRQPAPTHYRLRVGNFRVFYSVEADYVNIVRILSREDSIEYLGSG